MEYRVVKRDIGKATVKVKKQQYTPGKAIVPELSDITVKFGTEDPLNITDYEIVSASNNTGKGTATLVIRGLNDYGGTKTVKYEISTRKFIFN